MLNSKEINVRFNNNGLTSSTITVPDRSLANCVTQPFYRLQSAFDLATNLKLSPTTSSGSVHVKSYLELAEDETIYSEIRIA